MDFSDHVLICLSPGNIPSRWAHTNQIVRMAEAFSELLPTELVTAGSLFPAGTDIRGFYDIQGPLRIRKLPVLFRTPDNGSDQTFGDFPRYVAAALLYARLRYPAAVYTRSPVVARRCPVLNLRVIYELHEPEPDQKIKAAFARSREKSFLGLVTLNETLAERYVEWGFPPEKLFVWPDAVVLRRFDRMPSQKEARPRLGLSSNRPKVIYCGHFYESKGVPTLIEAARMLPEIDFILVGGWPNDMETMRQHAEAIPNVRFEEFQPPASIPVYLAAADILVLPNSGRGMHARVTSPLKLFEYMAASRPILASAIPAVDGLLYHKKNAFLFEPDNAEALARGVRTLLADERLQMRLSKQAAEDVRQYTWSRRAHAILNRFLPKAVSGSSQRL